MAEVFLIQPAPVTLKEIQQVVTEHRRIELSDEARRLIQQCRDYLDQKVAAADEPLYGINTGFGALYDRSVSPENLEKLQKNLVMSHACGTGEVVPDDIVRLMLLLKIRSLAYGYSGVQIETVQRLIDFYNEDVLPVVYRYGSLGASGDLAPLAHLCLPLLGMGEIRYKEKIYPAIDICRKFGWEPVKLKSKEGLALLNGTQFMSAYGVHLCFHVFHLSVMADVIGALSLDVYDGRLDPFHPLVQQIRPYKGQITTAKRIRWILEGSELIARHKEHIQDPYSFRCIPQIHGASKDSIDYMAYVFEREINSVTDNPTLFPEQDLIISAGNFHGQPLALALDNLSIAMAELGNISERRTYQLLSGARGLPPFLVANPGLNSGFMIPQYTSAALVSHNKQLCTPSSVDSIESSKGQEDHVSMGANAAIKAYMVMENLERILAIELFNAAQALDFRRPLKTSPYLETLHAEYRKKVTFIEEDKVMYPDMQASIEFLRSWKSELPI